MKILKKRKINKIKETMPQKYKCFGEYWNYKENNNLEQCNKLCNDEMQHLCRVEHYHIKKDK